MSTVTARFDGRGDYVDVTAMFRDFPRTGATRYNRPHLEVVQNGEQVHEEQEFFNGGVYQADAVRLPAKAGDRLEVRAWWSKAESRNGSALESTVFATHEVK